MPMNRKTHLENLWLRHDEQVSNKISFPLNTEVVSGTQPNLESEIHPARETNPHVLNSQPNLINQQEMNTINNKPVAYMMDFMELLPITINKEPYPRDKSHANDETLQATSRHSSQSTKTPSYLKEYRIKSALPTRGQLSTTFVAVKNGRSKYPLSSVISYDRLAPNHRVFPASISGIREPSTFKQAVSNPKWCDAMWEELDTLEKNGAWTLQPMPKGKSGIGC